MDDWIWFLFFVLYTVAFFVSRHLSYKFGVWDGAYNQFLPQVQKYMREYDGQH